MMKRFAKMFCGMGWQVTVQVVAKVLADILEGLLMH